MLFHRELVSMEAGCITLGISEKRAGSEVPLKVSLAWSGLRGIGGYRSRRSWGDHGDWWMPRGTRSMVTKERVREKKRESLGSEWCVEES